MTAITTGTRTPPALARAINLLCSEHGGPDWDDSTRELCEKAMLLRKYQQLAYARDLRTPISLQQILTLFEMYWAIGNAGQYIRLGSPESRTQPVSSPSPTPSTPQVSAP